LITDGDLKSLRINYAKSISGCETKIRRNNINTTSKTVGEICRKNVAWNSCCEYLIISMDFLKVTHPILKKKPPKKGALKQKPQATRTGGKPL
jgi:hypothetical protein